MAIHAIASPSAWDEQIVPALRKRLESESRTLSKRMSAVSVTSLDDPGPTLQFNTHYNLRDPTASPIFSQKGSAIPRPSLQSRPSTEAPFRVYTNGIPSSVSKSPVLTGNRSRTYSQSYTFDHPNGVSGTQKFVTVNGKPMTPDPSGSTLPTYVGRTSDVKPTRIPKVAPGRSGSTSSHGTPHPNMNPVMSNEGRNGSAYGPYTPPTSEAPSDLWRLKDYSQQNRSRSTVSVTSHNQQQHTLMHEPAPFTPGSSAAQSHDHSHDDGMASPRASNDSEERPFEHWYRGEVSRNGGVGELRVGKRMEMLDIANYGHTLRKARTPSNPRAAAISEDPTRRRHRTNSVSGIGERESLHLDDDRVNGEKLVLDETPLTDLEVDSEPDHDTAENYTTDFNGIEDSRVTTHDLRSGTPTSYRSSSRAQNGITPSRIPTPAPRQSSEPPRTVTPAPPIRGASEPPSFPPTPSSSRTQPIPRSMSQPGQAQTQTQTQTQKRRAKSPATASTSASKRTKSSLGKAKKLRDAEANRRSVAYYPAPAGEDGDIMDAIPSWTQPVPASGNWDEVVLPVVARKRGLDEHYEKADGGPRPPKPNSRVEPAPGTFGYNYSKYRPSLDDSESIQMDEFGRQALDKNAEEDERGQENDEKEHRDVQDDSGLPVRQPAPLTRLRSGDEVPMMSLNGGGVLKGRQREEPDEAEAGCCKCVIM